jgi:hypothetical protein
LLDDVARARQYAISRRTTVYMIFCPQNFWTDPAYAALPQTEKDKAAKLYDKQLNAYTFVTMRNVGEQPGRISPRYISPWRSMPEGAIIAPFKFQPRAIVMPIQDPPLPAVANRLFQIPGFSVTNAIPFPSQDAYAPGQTYVSVPYISFDYQGRLERAVDEYIPLARGGVGYARDPDKSARQAVPDVFESPPGNSSNAFTIVHIEWLTGRARLEKQEFP